VTKPSPLSKKQQQQRSFFLLEAQWKRTWSSRSDFEVSAVNIDIEAMPQREPALHILREMFDRVGVLENDRKSTGKWQEK
jgi:hypothetical protein